MRTFGEVKKYFEFQIEGEEKIHKIPLPAYLPNGIMLMMKEAHDSGKSFEGQLLMLKKYMGDEAVDNMSVDMADAILKAWGEESTKQGASAGES